MLSRIILLFLCLTVSVPGMSQVGHPAKGSWSGFIGPNAADSTRIRLLIHSEDGDLFGTINPGRRGVDASSIELDSSNWTLTVKANMPDGDIVLVGKLANLGSWTNRTYTGTYTLGSERGTFSINLN